MYTQYLKNRISINRIEMPEKFQQAGKMMVSASADEPDAINIKVKLLYFYILLINKKILLHF